MSFNITFYTNNSENNKLDKDLTELVTLTGDIKENSSFENPTIFIYGVEQQTHISQANYMYISQARFNRYYYITDIIVGKTRLYEVHGRVDVLMSFKSQIRANTGIVRRAESNTNYNLYINDGSLVLYQDPIVITKNFPSGFTGQSYVLTVAGG